MLLSLFESLSEVACRMLLQFRHVILLLYSRPVCNMHLWIQHVSVKGLININSD